MIGERLGTEYFETISEATKEGERIGFLAMDETMTDEEGVNQVWSGASQSKSFKKHPSLYVTVGKTMSVVTFLTKTPNSKDFKIHKK